jgi:NADPH:quinone reductase
LRKGIFGLVVYGASTSVGFVAIQLARHSNVHLMVPIVGHSTEHIRSILGESEGVILRDYRDENEGVVKAARDKF